MMMRGRDTHTTGARRSLSLAALSLLAIAGLACGPGDDTARPAASAGEHEFLNVRGDVAYVGMDECRECHLGIHTTYSDTGMGRALYPMTPEIAVEDFEDDNEFVVEDSGLRYRMFERDGKYWQRQFVLDSNGQEIAADERELVWVVGSNNHSRSYLTEIDGKTFQAPICWYPEVEKWDLCPGFEFKNEHFAREVSTSCLFCHNGRMELVEGERNEFERPFPHGIGCERCHGPGQLHVERWRTDEQPTGEADLTIVNPRRLPARERMDICSQCHLADARATARVGRFGRELDEYRPGMPLSEVSLAYRYEQQTQVEFGLSAQADRLVLSRCFTESGGKIECLTCHNPHVSVYHESRPADQFRKKCLGCHGPDDCGEEVAARSQTTPQDDCIACHMRKAEPDDQRFTEFTDHWIRKNTVFGGPDHRTDYTIRPTFPEDLAPMPRGEQSYYHARAAFLLATDVPSSSRDGLWRVAEEQFRAAIDAGYENQDVWFFLGKTLKFRGRPREAVDCFEQALTFDPEHHDALFALGKTWLENGRPEQAAGFFERLLEIYPNDAMSMAEYGRTLFTMGRAADASTWFQRAVAREPWDPTFQVNLGMSLAAVGKMQDAAQAGQRAVNLDPEVVDAWSLFHNAMREAGQADRAREGRRYAEELQRRLAASPEKRTAPSMMR